MSAIWGAISFDAKKIPDDHIQALKSGYANCVIDRFEEITESDVYMGCGIQYFTTEAQYEVLPFKKDTIYYNADAVLDNRAELLAKLGYSKTDNNVTDSKLLLDMIQKFGEGCLNEIIGAYTFVLFNREKNEVTILADAVGYRYVYYFVQDNILYYSSLLEPLRKIKRDQKFNERWIADYIGQDNLNAFTECEETPIDGINRVAPAQMLTLTRTSTHKMQYWSPFAKRKKIQYKTNEEYKKHFLELYDECITSLLRSPAETAILLSGGYDSTSVACLAAKELKRRGKKLYSFTSVPSNKYSIEGMENLMCDETDAVRKTEKSIDNLVCTFMDMPNMNCWHDRHAYQAIAEIPYKSPQNMLWLHESYKQAYQKNARILLGGMFGNATVSFDNAQLYYVWLFQRMKWWTLYKEISALSKKEHYTRKSVLKTAIKNAFNIDEDSTASDDIFKNSFTNITYLKAQGTDIRLKRQQKHFQKATHNYKLYHKAFMTMDTLRHYGEYQQKSSLYSGVILRDPTRDKRMIEFITSIPYSQFTNNGVRRNLIAGYMKDIIPEHILTERRIGRQSADLKSRIISDEHQIKQEWIANYKTHIKSVRIDCKKALTDLNNREIHDMSDFEIVRHIYTNMLLEYLT